MATNVQALVRALLPGIAVAVLSAGCAARRPPAPTSAPTASPELASPDPDLPRSPTTSPRGVEPRARGTAYRRAPATPAIVFEQAGYATYVARSFHGNTSASGETFDERELVAAHRTLPFGSIVRVTNVENGRSVTVRIIDRGPYGKNDREGTIIDVSRAAAQRLRMIRDGQVRARVAVLEVGDGSRVKRD
jgi:rare lipoprotein A